MKKISVLGASGMLGYAVSSYFKNRGYEVVEITRNEFDIAKDEMNKLEAYFDGVDVVINCAGIIKPTLKLNSVEDVLKINSRFPRNLAKLCNSKGIECFHITTDCVFSGKKGSYTENDYFDADDLYGLSKNAGENKDCMTLRTSIIGEEKEHNRSLLEWAKSQAGKSVNGFTNHFWNGVTTLYLAEIIENILNNGLYEEGIFHVYSPEPVDKYQLLSIINDVYNLELQITPIETENPIDRTLFSVYNLSEKVSIKSLSEQIREMHNFFSHTEKEVLKAV